MEIITKQLADLHPDPKNAREHDERNKESVRKSLQTFGQIEPLVINGKGKVIGGNCRLQVMLDEGMTEAECVIFVGTPQEETQLALALNRSAQLADWNYGQLQELLDSFDGDEDLMAVAGFTEDEYDRLFGDPQDISKEWDDAGMPECDSEKQEMLTIKVHFKDETDRDSFAELIGQKITDKTTYLWHPPQEKEDLQSLEYTEEG